MLFNDISECLELNLCPMHRVQCDHGAWLMSVGWRELELEPLKDHAQSHLGLEQREVLTDAGAWPPAEREERGGRLGDPLGEPVRPELVRVAAPEIRVMVDKQHGQFDHNPGRVSDAAGLHLLVRFPADRDGRRVQPENFVKNHCQLHGWSNNICSVRPTTSGLEQVSYSKKKKGVYQGNELTVLSRLSHRIPACFSRTGQRPPLSHGPATPGACIAGPLPRLAAQTWSPCLRSRRACTPR